MVIYILGGPDDNKNNTISSWHVNAKTHTASVTAQTWYEAIPAYR